MMVAVKIRTFSDLLETAHAQPEPQRLLLVFTVAELPLDGTEQERAAFHRGEGGALTPVVCVDKLASEIESFDALELESRQALSCWDIMFIAALGGRAGAPPNSDEAAGPLRMMAESIRVGRIANFIAVNRNGEFIELRRG